MNIIEKLGNKVNEHYFHYYGIGDSSSYFDLEDIIKNINIIDEYFKAKPYKLVNFDDYIDYIFLDKFSQFDNIIKFVQENKKQEVQRVVDLILQYYKCYQKKDIIKYLNKEYKSIIDNSKYDIIEKTLDIAIKYYSGCMNILKYIIDTHCYIVVYNFDRYQNVILKNQELIDKVLDLKHFDEMKLSGIRQYLSVVAFLYKRG